MHEIKTTAWVNWLGWIILVPGFIALVDICIRVTPPIKEGDDMDKLLNNGLVVGLLVIAALEMIMRRKKAAGSHK